MSLVVLSLQALLALVAIVAVIQRCRVLLFVAPLSSALSDALARALAASDESRARALAEGSARRWGSRLVLTVLNAEPAERKEQLDLELGDLLLLAEAQLGLIRVAATMGSTLGLLGGILAIQRGFSGHGLLALRAGLAQQVAVSEALEHMAIGIGTAAFCFAAFGLLRGAARELRSQTTQIASVCRLWLASGDG